MLRFTKILLCAFLSTFLLSCSKQHSNVVIMHTDFPNEEWGRFDFLRSTYEITKAPEIYDIVLSVEFSDAFPNIYPQYSNEGDFAINMTVSTPDGGGKRSKDYKFQVKDSDGNWKSEKINGHYTFEFPLLNEMTFSEKGLYQFKIENKYTKDPLYGIKNLTIKAIKK